MISLIILDIDGVLTDGRKDYDNNGNVFSKKFNDKDFTAIKRFKASDINVCFLSGDTNVNKKIAELRNIQFYSGRNHNGKMNKIDILDGILNDFNAKSEDTVYVGDDIFDIEIFKEVGYSFCPNDSPNVVKQNAQTILFRNGGEGIVAEIYDYLIDKQLINDSSIENVKNLDALEGASLKMTSELKDNVFFEIDQKSVDFIKINGISMINKAQSGHPGAVLGLAPTIYTIFSKFLRFNPNDSNIYNHDRFVLSNGHASALLYSTLLLFKYNITYDDLMKFRQIGSITPGHPEVDIPLHIHVATGPLGQGIANGVGMAIACKKLTIDNNIYIMCGDGCLMEGISYESMSLAGHLGLDNIIIIFDNNSITIDGRTSLTFSENILLRMKSINWNYLEINDGNDMNLIYSTINNKPKNGKPTFISVKTIIGFGSKLQDTSEVHGSALKNDDYLNIVKTLKITEPFKNYHDINLHIDEILKSKPKLNICFKENSPILPERYSLKNTGIATRQLSYNYLKLFTQINKNNFIIGSADLSESNKIKTTENNIFNKDNYNGYYLHYGIREHAMGAIAIGISSYNIIPIIGTFLVFITYCLAPIRMAALSKHRVIYILTHDSIGLGEDGPTHQPIESLSILRNIPNVLTLRPSNSYELEECYHHSINHNGPSCICLSRQNIKVDKIEINDIEKGGYLIYKNFSSNEIPDITILSSGSEVELSINYAKQCNKNINVVSIYSLEIFEKQETIYKESLIMKDSLIISIEASNSLPWKQYTKHNLSIERFGLSGKAEDLFQYFNFTIDGINKIVYK